MTVGELIELLNGYDDNADVVFKPSNSSYVEDFGYVKGYRAISSFYGSDYESLVIVSDGQCGSL